MKRFIAASALALFATGASAATVDFGTNLNAVQNPASTTQHGEIVDKFDFGNGLTGFLIVDNAGQSAAGEARIFDSGLTGTSDRDLEGPFTSSDTPSDIRDFGNILIIQERANLASSIADDERSGGSITFVFDQAINLVGLDYLDGERGASVVAGMQTLGTLASGINGDNEFSSFDFAGNSAAEGITQFRVDFGGSGAIGGFEATLAAVPVPAALPLMLLGLGGLGALRRRKSKTA